MDIITLRVFNTIHKLEISEKEFCDIENEQKEETRSGIYIAAIKKGFAIYVNHNEKHRIMIKKLAYEGKIPYPSRILLKTLITFTDIPEQIYLLHRIGGYRASDTGIKHIANNIDELKDFILGRFMDGYPQELGGEYEDVFGDSQERVKAKKKKPILIEKQLKALYWLFGEEYDGQEVYSRLNVARIIKVWQHKNRRTALFQEKECWKLERGCFHTYDDIDRITYRIKTYAPKDKEYNYVCPNREVGLTNNDDCREIWLDDDLFEKVQPDDLQIIQKIANGWFLTADKMVEFQRQIRTEKNMKRRKEEIEEAESILKNNIQKQFKEGRVIRRGITFTPEGFSYEGIAVKGDGMKEYLVRNNIILLQEPNFNQILDGFIEYALDIQTDYNYYPYDRQMCFLKGEKNIQVGDIKIKVLREKGRITVNDYRIAREEVEHILKKAINYKVQKEYDSFLGDVAKVSLRLQEILKRGYFQFEVNLLGNDDCDLSLPEKKMVLAIPVVRENNKNFIIIGEEKFPIKNIQSFLKLEFMNSRSICRYEGSELQRVIVQLHKAAHNLSAENISIMIEDGIETYKKKLEEEKKIEKEKIKKSDEFLAHAIKLTNAEKIKDGYIVQGLSGTEYSVNSDSLAVYTMKDGKPDQYLCIIDEHSNNSTEWGKKDIVAKRLLMLSKDIKIAREVHTLGDKMDAHWMEVVNE